MRILLMGGRERSGALCLIVQRRRRVQLKVLSLQIYLRVIWYYHNAIAIAL